MASCQENLILVVVYIMFISKIKMNHALLSFAARLMKKEKLENSGK